MIIGVGLQIYTLRLQRLALTLVCPFNDIVGETLYLCRISRLYRAPRIYMPLPAFLKLAQLYFPVVFMSNICDDTHSSANP